MRKQKWQSDSNRVALSQTAVNVVKTFIMLSNAIHNEYISAMNIYEPNRNPSLIIWSSKRCFLSFPSPQAPERFLFKVSQWISFSIVYWIHPRNL